MKILVVDDDQGMREFLDIVLSREGFQVITAADGKEAFSLCRKNDFDLAITDLKMPKIDGIALLKKIKETSPQTPVIVITGYASGETAISAMQEGAYDYLEKNFDVDELVTTVRDALKSRDAKAVAVTEPAKDDESFDDMIGTSRQMRKIFERIRKVSQSTANVLILGESGTGKELVSQAIHNHSPRRGNPFVVINCGGIPETLLESEFFGYMKGSFSGAYMNKPGLFETAHTGTVFLDEVGELSPFLQVKLLRVVQNRKFRRIGGTEDITVDVRIIAATNQDLEKKVHEGEFREDLYYRLNVVPVRLPSLRERREDIPLLVDHFIEKYSTGRDKARKKISSYALSLLMEYPFPGNIRELENIIERSMALETGNIILPESLIIRDEAKGSDDNSVTVRFNENGMDINETLKDVERFIITRALEKTNGSKAKAADLLQVSFDSLRYRIEKLNLP